MFNRHSTAVHQIDLATSFKLATVVTVLGMLTAPALAAPSVQIPCPEASAATLHVSDTTLATKFVNHNAPAASMSEVATDKKLEVSASSSLLAPRAVAAIRDAFGAGEDKPLTSSQPELAKAILALPVTGADSKTEQADESVDTSGSDVGMNAKLPGISDEDLSRYKKRMYRRDI